MVYSKDTSEAMQGNKMAERAAQGVKLLGAGVVKVVHRCDDAKETKILDLSSCSLTQVPDAVYFLMRASDGKQTKVVHLGYNNFVLQNQPLRISLHFTKRIILRNAICLAI